MYSTGYVLVALHVVIPLYSCVPFTHSHPHMYACTRQSRVEAMKWNTFAVSPDGKYVATGM